MRVTSVVGARPQFVKLAPVAAALRAAGAEHRIVHTGQHYDAAMSEVFFRGLGIPEPDAHLGVGSGTHAAQTAATLAALEPVLLAEPTDWVLVYGDTNATLAAALAAVKAQLPVAHLEAGLRSFNRRMPEEHNRVLTDHAADLLLAPTGTALDRLAAEGLAGRSVLVGDVMTDVCLRVAEEHRRRPGPAPEAAPRHGRYLLATLHRAENTDDAERLGGLLGALAALPVPVLLPVHPRLAARAETFGFELARGAVRPLPPLPYRELLGAVLGSAGVLTDSGGLQKEAGWLGRPCTTLRAETEWPETLAGGWNVLAADPASMPPAAWAELACRPAPGTAPPLPDGAGRVAERVVRELLRHCR